MKKKIACLAGLGIMSAATASGSGYRIPEQSINGVALSNAYIAHTDGPDTAYYNPANMGWQEDRWQLEASASYINLPGIDYKPAASDNVDTSKTENIVIPMLHAMSPDYNNFRFGFSFLVPYGLSKRWHDAFPRTFAEEFTLNILEANPSVSYTFRDRFALAAGARLLHSTGNALKNSGFIAPGVHVSSDMDGDATSFGYNAALTVKPARNWVIAATYRSKAELDLSGDAVLTASHPLAGSGAYRGEVDVTAPAPAVFTLGTSYTFARTTVELTWDRTYWSIHEDLDFDFASPLSANPYLDAIMFAAFEAPKTKNWRNSNAYRLGVTHKYTDRFTAMVGLAYDETPIPDDTLGFELPDADARLFSFGGRYRLDDNLEVGGAYLLDLKKTRRIDDPDNPSHINGKFEDAGAHVVTLGLVYKF
ncbi:MAG: outer membrane protein transport protein [Deltaproteobacteria bacterium]|nr:outer membrane protein transport protein [Deltaproteobacteria bacterium]